MACCLKYILFANDAVIGIPRCDGGEAEVAAFLDSKRKMIVLGLFVNNSFFYSPALGLSVTSPHHLIVNLPPLAFRVCCYEQINIV